MNSNTSTPRPQRDQGQSSSLAALKVDELIAALKKKDDDMRAMEERYKMYLEKARNVSDDLWAYWVRCLRATSGILSPLS